MKKKQTKVVKKLSPERVKEILLTEMSIPGDLKENIRQLGDNILPKLSSSGGNSEVKDNLNAVGMEALVSLGVQTHAGLMISFSQEYRGLAKELTMQIIDEYDCTTNLEKMQAEMIAHGFVRTLDCSKRLNSCMDAGEYITSERTKHLGMLSKQLDRSHRQYTSALMMLKNMKAPSIEMKIKANTAFVSQNQQINANSGENNESK